MRLTFEPGGTGLGRSLRGLVLDAELALTDWEETWLFLAARASHVESIIRPALEAGEVVICDRFSDSTLAYQGYGRGLPLARLERLNAEATGGLEADRTLVLDVPAALGLARARARARARQTGPDRIGDAALAFHERVNAGFRTIAQEAAGRVRLLDASGSEEAVRAAARSALRDVLGAE